MRSLLKKLTEAGLESTRTPLERRGVLLSNQISLIVFFLGIIQLIIYYWWFGITVTALSIPPTCLICLCIIGLNKIGFTTLSRVIISLFVPVVTTAVSIYSKGIYYEVLQPIDYFTYRFLILGTSVFPAVIFSMKEKKFLISTILANLSLLMLYDPLHEAFGVGYFINHTIGYYHFVNIVIFITYWILLGTVLFLKRNAEKNEEKNYQLIIELNDQQHEILAQAEELSTSHQRLQQANEVITKQNVILESNLIDRSQELSDANKELIKNISELNQFSFAVSHNLRGPIASLLGLTKLLKKEKLDSENREIFTHIQSSTVKLDEIIRDLNTVIDIRHTIFEDRQNVRLDKEVDEIRTVFQKELEEFNAIIECDFTRCKEITSIKPMIQSILSNLVSNSIKYHSAERKPVIKIGSDVSKDAYVLFVEDNGLGIDLGRDGENLFKLFRRFHDHKEGKGLGLYLVKTQVEALGGKVEVESEVNRFTRFTVRLQIPQVAYQENGRDELAD